MKRTTIDTKVIHAGEPHPHINRSVVVPIFQTAMYMTAEQEEYHDIKYIRLNNTPNHDVLALKLAALENAEAALVTGSGMAAISTTLFAFLSAGDHVIAQDCLYGGTHDLFTQDFPSMGIEVTFIDGTKPESWKAALRKNTKVMYIETISNPLMGVPALKEAARFARENTLVSMIDNTFASPVNYRPAEHGIDISLHSATKYLNGHSDIVAGAVIGSAEHIERVRHKLNHFGGTLDPHACFLLHRGIRTLALRVRYQNESALNIARFLEEHPRVTRVNYPGLQASPDFTRASEVFDGFGGMVSFEVDGSIDDTMRVLKKLQIPLRAPSLGGVESLVTQPSMTSHRGMSKADREKVGITDGLVRYSVGIESVDDLIDDLRQSLEK